MDERGTEELLNEMRSIKMLLILQLIGQGFRQRQIAQFLGISEASMSRMLPKGAAKAVPKGGSASREDSE